MGGEALELQKPKQPIYADVAAAAASLFGYKGTVLVMKRERKRDEKMKRRIVEEEKSRGDLIL